MHSLTIDRLDTILNRARQVRVTVVGDLMLDVYLAGSVTRISPEAPVPVVQVDEERSALGGAANVGANVVALGAHCDLVGVIGNDSGGRGIRDALGSLNGDGAMRPLLIEHAERPTTTKTRVMARHQQVVRFDRERDDDVDPSTAQRLVEALQQSAAAADVIALEDYNKGVLTPLVIRTALEIARERGIPVVVDPKFRHIFEFRGATVFKPNALELTAALGRPIRPDDDEFLEEARDQFECEHLLLTLGERGMALSSAGEPPFRIPTAARQVYDVSGAGDTVTASVAVAIAAGATMREAAILANLAAGIGVGKAGVATISPAEIRDELQDLLESTSEIGIP